MILFHGDILENKEQKRILEILEEDCLNTLNCGNQLLVSKIILACDTLYKRVISGMYDDLIMPLVKMMDLSHERFLEMASMFSKENLEYKCKIELGNNYLDLEPLKSGTKRYYHPLGILFHIAAGNVDGLPAYSVIEGLLTGNINILKLPTGDSGLSIKLLSELIKIEPSIKDYIYVFDVPSTDVKSLEVFARIADGIVVWGGDGAVEAARKMASVTTKIIAWGHKLSFAYASLDAKDEDLKLLAKHICLTNQVLCSSCQGIFVDTDNFDELDKFGRRFFTILKEVNKEVGKVDIGMRGKNMINIYNDLLEKERVNNYYFEDGVSVAVKMDSELELSYMFRNVWIKRLPFKNIIKNLKKHKNHLQTCGLICDANDKDKYSNLLIRSGVIKITNGDMSKMVPGEAHDGTYPLREYLRIVEIS